MKKTGEIDADGSYRRSCLVQLERPHVDARGLIQMLVNTPVHNVSIISSKKNSVRSNHYHVHDWHYMYLLSGALKYYFRKHGSEGPVEHFLAKAGDMIWTPPMEDHATVFTEDTTLLAMSLLPRNQEAYESDVRRIALVDPSTLELVA